MLEAGDIGFKIAMDRDLHNQQFGKGDPYGGENGNAHRYLEQKVFGGELRDYELRDHCENFLPDEDIMLEMAGRVFS